MKDEPSTLGSGLGSLFSDYVPYATTVQQLKVWLKEGQHKKPFTGQQVKAAGLGDWLRGDKEGLDWRWGMVGGSLVRIPVTAGLLGYAKGVVPRIAGASTNLAERNIYRKLLEQARQAGVTVGKGHASQYNPATAAISMAKGFNAPGVLAHELGHVNGGKGLIAANMIGKNGIGLGTLASMLAKDEDKSKRNAWIGTAFGGAMLASEVDASRRGYRAIRSLGGGRGSALKSYIGVPTYAAFAATPMLSHLLKKHMGGFDNEKRASEHVCGTNTCPDCGGVLKCKCGFPSGYTPPPRVDTADVCGHCRTKAAATSLEKAALGQPATTHAVMRVSDLAKKLQSKVRWSNFQKLPDEYGLGMVQKVDPKGFKFHDYAPVTQPPNVLFRGHGHPDVNARLPVNGTKHFGTPGLFNALNYMGGVGVKHEDTIGKARQATTQPLMDALQPLFKDTRLKGFVSQFTPSAADRFGRDYSLANSTGTLAKDVIARGADSRDMHEVALTGANKLLSTGLVQAPGDAMSEAALRYGELSSHPEWESIKSEFARWPGRFKQAATEPSTIGSGLGSLFSDYVPYAPSGARRAGAASLMAERIGEKPGALLKYPMISQILAMMGGGITGGITAEMTRGAPVPTALAAIAPYLVTQGLKRHRIKEISKLYKEKKRKRLSEVDSDGMVDDAMGSHRLGMAQANDAMRNRKYRDIGAIAEAGDTLPIATSMMGLGAAASLPFTQLIDHLESRKFINKEAAWTDQINGPAIPAYLAAAGLGSVGLMLAGKKLHKDLNDPNLPNLDRKEWDGLAKHVSGRDLLSAQIPNLNNAFFTRARNDEEAKQILGQYALHDPEVRKKLSILDPMGKKLRRQVQDHGIMAFDPAFGKASIVGHEAGHAKIEHTPGILQSLQRNLYQYSPLIAPLSAVGGLAAGLASKSTLGGLLAGTGIGLVGGAGMMFPEYMATHHGMKGLKSYKGGKFAQDGDWGRQLTALGTYGSLNVLPAALSGMFGGFIGKRRAEKRRAEAEREAREAGEDPENVVRMDENARNVEKAARAQ